YTVEELYAGFKPEHPGSYEACFDARVYRRYLSSGGERCPSILETLARRLHDHAIADALHDLLERRARRCVAIMGGHSMRRGGADYRRVAVIARALTRRGYFMLSGGGPGAMEATHLGAWLAPQPDAALDEALI